MPRRYPVLKRQSRRGPVSPACVSVRQAGDVRIVTRRVAIMLATGQWRSATTLTLAWSRRLRPP